MKAKYLAWCEGTKYKIDNCVPFGKGKNCAQLAKLGERFLLLSLAFAQEKVTKEKSARLAPARSLRKMQSIFLRCAPLPPPPRGEAVGLAVIRMTAEPFIVLHCCVVGIRRPNAGGRERGTLPKRRGKGTIRAPAERKFSEKKIFSAAFLKKRNLLSFF